MATGKDLRRIALSLKGTSKAPHFDRSPDLMNLANDALGRKIGVPSGPVPPDSLNNDRDGLPEYPPQKHRHPRNVRILPQSRDFH